MGDLAMLASQNRYLLMEVIRLRKELSSMQDLFLPFGTGPGALDKMLLHDAEMKADAYRWREFQGALERGEDRS